MFRDPADASDLDVPDVEPEASSLSEKEPKPSPWLRCGDCGAPITPESARMTIRAAHVHEFMNPSGIRFAVACFSSAPGCMPVGERSTVWTWFPGFAWQIELCRRCAAHLGWSFHPAGGEPGALPFYGLVRDRLVGP